VANVTIHNVAEAKAQLSRLLDAALAGEEVVVARAGRPLVQLVPITPPKARELGFLPMTMPDDRFDPLDADDLDGWS
jgi:prevent-host-death family protein